MERAKIAKTISPKNWIYLCFTMVIILSAGIPLEVFGQIYKWKDEKGVTHYTDSMQLVPLDKRSDPNLRVRAAYGNSKRNKPKKEKENDKTSSDSEGEKNKLDADPKILERAIGLFTSEIERDKKLSSYFPNSVNGKKINSQLQAGVGPKKDLYQVLLEIETPAIQEARAFLKTNIEEDQSVSALGPRFKTKMRQTISRLKDQIPIKEGIVSKLQEELAIVSENKSAKK